MEGAAGGCGCPMEEVSTKDTRMQAGPGGLGSSTYPPSHNDDELPEDSQHGARGENCKP